MLKKKKGTSDKLIAYDANAARVDHEREVFPNKVANKCAFAVGARWVAYPSPESIPEENEDFTKSPSSLSSSSSPIASPSPSSLNPKERSKEENSALTVSGLASSLYHFGDAGRQKMVDYIYDKKEVAPNAGIVMVYDAKMKKTIAHFKAHKNPISHLIFDPSGTLLVTASDGHNINVFRIAKRDSPLLSSSHLYSLRRGFTNAHILSISFTKDSRWLSVCSGRGTNRKYQTLHLLNINHPFKYQTLHLLNINHPFKYQTLHPYIKHYILISNIAPYIKHYILISNITSLYQTLHPYIKHYILISNTSFLVKPDFF